jgi:hypothetical protein
MYHFSGPSASINPTDELELSDPRRCLPLDNGVDAPPGGDKLMLCGVLTPGERDSGETWCLWDDAATPVVVADREVLGFGCGDEDVVFKGCEVEDVALVAIVRVFVAVIVEVTVLDVVETWAEEASPEGEVGDEVAL